MDYNIPFGGYSREKEALFLKLEKTRCAGFV